MESCAECGTPIDRAKTYFILERGATISNDIQKQKPGETLFFDTEKCQTAYAKNHNQTKWQKVTHTGQARCKLRGT
jgi:hypothetical protein